ncbi:hypothetical protein OBBRIDRAFT_806715 [Obba rivulosa]|uniref:Fungal-type protein kinase domain-containing protein n=1 Tax=Obba rivulosa TaxID=1052685 RepID=A0A8E2AL15_9APHY|nr:hypothetical protein OBBRIDRAFT_806715 [Obba rivulosa]
MDTFSSLFFRYYFSRLKQNNRPSSSSASNYSDEDVNMSDSHSSHGSNNDESHDKLMPLSPIGSERLPERRHVTPSPRHAQSVMPQHSTLSSSGEHTTEAEPELGEDIGRDRRQKDYPILDFIEHIYGVDAKRIYRPSATPIHIERGLINMFCGASNERESYNKFIKIMTSLVHQMHLVNRNRFSIIYSRERILDGDFVDNKPDLLVAMRPVFFEDIKINWDLIFQIQEPTSVARKKCKLGGNAQADAPSGAKRAKRNSITPADASDKTPQENDADKDSVEKEANKSKAKGPKLFTRKQMQTLKYLNQLMSSGVHSYATVILMQNTTIMLWYCDCIGVIISKPFDFLEQPHYLALLSAALMTADLEHLGVSPFLHFPDSDFTTFKQPLSSSNMRRILTTEISREASNSPSVGRGTTVLPVKTPPSLTEQFGREDVVAKVAWPLKGWLAEASYVKVIRDKLKDHKEGSAYLRHIPEIKYSLEYTIRDLSLPRYKMHDPAFLDNDERICRAIIAKAYIPLQMVDSIEEFKTVIVGAIQGHHWAWEVPGVLHRDIGVENIMFYRTGSGVVGILNEWDHAVHRADLPVNGKFNLVEAIVQAREKTREDEDQDNENKSSSNNHRDQPSAHPPIAHSGSTADHVLEEEPQPSAAKQVKYRTGIGPFMAIELLDEGVIPFHRYRFDLESFFYVLVWFCLRFSPVAHEVYHVEDWQHTNLWQIGVAKALFLNNPNVQANIVHLCTFIRMCAIGPSDENEQHMAEWEKTVMEYECAWEQAVTYEKFMCILGVQV